MEKKCKDERRLAETQSRVASRQLQAHLIDPSVPIAHGKAWASHKLPRFAPSSNLQVGRRQDEGHVRGWWDELEEPDPLFGTAGRQPQVGWPNDTPNVGTTQTRPTAWREGACCKRTNDFLRPDDLNTQPTSSLRKETVPIPHYSLLDEQDVSYLGPSEARFVFRFALLSTATAPLSFSLFPSLRLCLTLPLPVFDPRPSSRASQSPAIIFQCRQFNTSPQD